MISMSVTRGFSEFAEKKEQDNYLSNSFIIYQDHINYIKKIRENELLDLINRYKKSLLYLKLVKKNSELNR